MVILYWAWEISFCGNYLCTKHVGQFLSLLFHVCPTQIVFALKICHSLALEVAMALSNMEIFVESPQTNQIEETQD